MRRRIRDEGHHRDFRGTTLIGKNYPLIVSLLRGEMQNRGMQPYTTRLLSLMPCYCLFPSSQFLLNFAIVLI